MSTTIAVSKKTMQAFKQAKIKRQALIRKELSDNEFLETLITINEEAKP